MPARLILNADDFGLTRGINRAIAELHSAGVHFLCDADGRRPRLRRRRRCCPRPPLARRWLPHRSHRRRARLAAQLDSQPDRSRRKKLPPIAGRFCAGSFARTDQGRRGRARSPRADSRNCNAPESNPTHIDTHKHTHLFPAIARPLLQVADRCGIRAIRNPFEPDWSPRARPRQPRATPRRPAHRLAAPAFRSAPPTVRRAHPHHRRHRRDLCHRPAQRRNPRRDSTRASVLPAPTSSAAIPVTTTASSTASPPACAPNATSSAKPCSARFREFSVNPMLPRSSTTGIWRSERLRHCCVGCEILGSARRAVGNHP